MNVDTLIASRRRPFNAQHAGPVAPRPWSVRNVTEIDEEEFVCEHLTPEVPVHVSGLCAEWEACRRWSPRYLAAQAPELTIPVKVYRDGAIDVSPRLLRDYAELLSRLDQPEHAAERSARLPYCHDIPLFAMVPSLVDDCRLFPTGFLTRWYRDKWWRYAQFFLGPTNSLTPLHFDTLLTHNLFFQIRGRKRFTLLPPEQMGYCGRRGWRWFDVDPEAPDHQRFPNYHRATPVEILLEPGDMLYLPPGTLHHVRGLDTSISFNVDFHTRRSSLRSLAGIFDGMPAESAYYNVIAALGVVLGIPSSLIFRFYRPYLSYVS